VKEKKDTKPFFFKLRCVRRSNEIQGIRGAQDKSFLNFSQMISQRPQFGIMGLTNQGNGKS